MAAAGLATAEAEAATAPGAKWPEAPRDRFEACSLRASERLFPHPEGGLVASWCSTKSRRAAILASCISFWTVGSEDLVRSCHHADSAAFLAATTRSCRVSFIWTGAAAARRASSEARAWRASSEARARRASSEARARRASCFCPHASLQLHLHRGASNDSCKLSRGRLLVGRSSGTHTSACSRFSAVAHSRSELTSDCSAPGGP
eukprot:scaffold4267_cov61-Phaeocystis_antarctica.AAC.3